MVMEIKNENLNKALEEIAYKKTDQFCYACYKVVKTSHCPTCLSDDFMRHLDGVGVEYGIDWVIDHLIEENLESVDTDEIFEEMIRDCYSETVKVGWLELDTVNCIKDQDPISYDIAKNEYIYGLVDDEQLIQVKDNYYWIHDVEKFIEENGV